MSTTSTHTVTVDDLGAVELTVTERGSGRPVVVLHGGAGPRSVDGWADQLADAGPFRVLTPVHPGFEGTPRPDALESVRGLAALYAAFLDEAGLRDALVIGNSVGGWIAAELAALGPERVSGYVLVDAVGLAVPGHPVVDFFSLSPAEVAQHSFYDPAMFDIDPTTMSPEARAATAANMETLRRYAGTDMVDPTLAERLPTVSAPTLVVWGAADRVGDPDLGRALAAAVPGATFTLLERAGHLPQLEQPQELIELVRGFAHGPGAAAR